MALSAFLFSDRIKIDGEIVRLLLRRRKIKQGRAAKFLRISDAQLVQHLNGKYAVPFPRLKRLLKLLGVSDPALIVLREAPHA